jgi:hypothetical protein
MSYTNGYDQGYAKGYSDGFIRQTKSSTGGFGIPETLKALITPDTWRSEFQRGYEMGYLQGIFIYKQNKDSL